MRVGMPVDGKAGSKPRISALSTMLKVPPYWGFSGPAASCCGFSGAGAVGTDGAGVVGAPGAVGVVGVVGAAAGAQAARTRERDIRILSSQEIFFILSPFHFW